MQGLNKVTFLRAAIKKECNSQNSICQSEEINGSKSIRKYSSFIIFKCTIEVLIFLRMSRKDFEKTNLIILPHLYGKNKDKVFDF